MVGRRRCPAGVLQPGEYRSSSGSIAGLALASQSPNLWRHETAVVTQAMFTMLSRTAAPRFDVQSARAMARDSCCLLGYRASLVAENRRTIERRLICTLHLGERSILRFRISRMSLARRRSAHLLPQRYPVVDVARSAIVNRGLQARRTAATVKRSEPPAYRDAPYLRAGKSC